ncbi:MAG TPA: hypothetical protein VGE29_08065 [Prosthecobacter sp.]
MKLNLFMLGLLAALGLSSCSTYVEQDPGYVAVTPGYIYRGPPHHHRPPYYGSRLYYEGGQPVEYSSTTRYYEGGGRTVHTHTRTGVAVVR